MSKIIKNINYEVVKKTAARCKKRGITIPTFAQMKNPETIPAAVKSKLSNIGLWDVNPLNLYRITWKNEIKTGLYGAVNFFEIPKAITGVDARIVGIVGKYFPTGAHKVGFLLEKGFLDAVVPRKEMKAYLVRALDFLKAPRRRLSAERRRPPDDSETHSSQTARRMGRPKLGGLTKGGPSAPASHAWATPRT